MSTTPPRRVAIVGSGASGMSAAYALSKHPDKFSVTVFEKQDVPGGMATSIDIDADKFGASYINDGVQGCSPAFANTMRLFRELGYEATEVDMQISFGKGGDFWSNVFPSELTAHFAGDIKKFGRALKVIKALEGPFALVPVHVMLRLFGFSKDFGEKMVYPLVALFFGTGNQTPYISSAILERVFKDPSMKLFEYNDKSLLASIPKMYAFPKLHDVYSAWRDATAASGNVTFRYAHEVTGVVERTKGHVVVEYRLPPGIESASSSQSSSNGADLTTTVFDAIILAVDADAALKLLSAGKGPSWLEKKILGAVKYLRDVTITHSDADYMRKYYETAFNPDLAAKPENEGGNAEDGSSSEQDALAFARDNFRPLYYTMQYPENRAKLEMSFDLTHYQPQFRGVGPRGPVAKDKQSDAQGDTAGSSGSESGDDAKDKEPPFERHVFQTIFLDEEGSSKLWTIGDIKKEDRIYEKWWKQQSHRWQHYARVVPWMWMINGKSNTYYAGAWTVLNMHELAVTSGFAAAYQLGADYPFKGDEDCQRLFALYLGLSHGSRMRKEDRKGIMA
ncbi:FAD/NAD(P)-binding domain-containing protein [Auriscalpium vulgare]|uniref:FAD/NAD(P)-binding domain-containing protein n=1 Tax=Auriscalpium vulgare TaxID=40419 RepID=A0ACB8S4J0_9AGAM|nr:FAD/NAD(P)-binding domain-containing protein [Auriscalpium vulgare]